MAEFLDEDKERVRFETELEFVQSLANPDYLNCMTVKRFHFNFCLVLAQNQYFKQKAFVNYLNYLTYWFDGKYTQYITYPNSLVFLKLLQEQEFREKLEYPDFCAELKRQQWKVYENESNNQTE